MLMAVSPLILAIDLGTSGPKVVVFTRDLDILGSAFCTTRLQIFEGGGATQDPADWWAAIEKATLEVLAQPEIDGQQIEAIVCTSQWSGTVAVDPEGNVLYPAMTWMDSRGTKEIEKLNNGFPKIEGYALGKLIQWLRLTGGAPEKSGKDSLAHILYLKAKEPEIYRQTYKFLEPKDYLNLRLSGVFCTTPETMTLHWLTDNRNPDKITYHEGLLRMAGLQKAQFPEIVASTSVIGKIRPEIAAQWNLNPEAKILGGTPDVHSAAIGSGAVKDFEAHLYIGTSAWLTCHVPFKKTDLFHNMAALPAGIPGRYLILNEQETAGECVDFFKDHILFPENGLAQSLDPEQFYQAFDALAAQVLDGSEGLMFFPWLFGERSPVEDAHVRGAFVNLALNHSQAHLCRAILEGVAYNTRWLMKYVEKMIRREFAYIHFIGGGARSDAWSQILADVLNRPIKQLEQPLMANARGAAALAAVNLGWTSFEKISEKIKVRKVYQPNPEVQALHEERFRLFTRYYKRNKTFFRKLNRG
jgi:xylulokinase